MAVWLPKGIVLGVTSSSRWATTTVDTQRKTTALSLFSGMVFLVLIASYLPLTTGLLSFFSVDQIQRTDLKQTGILETRGNSFEGISSYSDTTGVEAGLGRGESSERTMGESRRKSLEKLFGNSSSGDGGQGPWKRKDNRRDVGRGRDGGRGCDRMRPQRQMNCDLPKKQARKGLEVAEVKGQQLTWDQVIILDEHELKHEVDTGRTRIRFLPDGRLISTFLNRGLNGRFLFPNSMENGSISIVITPCNSILTGTVSLLPSNSGNLRKFYVAFKRNKLLETFRTEKTLSFKIPNTQRGVYLIELRPVYTDTYVHLFVTANSNYDDPFDLSWSTKSDDLSLTPSALSRSGRLHFYNFLNLHNWNPPKPWIGVKRLWGSRVQVKWDPSPVNPHRMTYCIVVNTVKDYASLCGATGDKFGILPPDLTHLPIYQFYPPTPEATPNSDPGQGQESSSSSSGERARKRDMIVGCLRKKTNYILTDLQEGTLYHFNVFVKDVVTGLSFPYVRVMHKYQMSKVRGNILRDAKSVKAKLGPDPVTFEFKVNKPCSELTIYLMPCGGGEIDYKIVAENHTIYEATTIDTLDIVKMAFPIRAKYYITISQAISNQDEVHNNRARMVEVFVSKKQKKFPLPKLPVNRTISELVNERGCDTVTIQWYTSLDFRDNEYCIFLKEDRRKGAAAAASIHFKTPNQCDLERSLLNDPYVVLSYCTQKVATVEREILTERIQSLKPATSYILQLIVKRHNGKSALSYDFTHVQTLSKCLNE